jgi:hypothetical protein
MTNSKVYLIGDCQSNRIYEHYNEDPSFINLFLWGKGGKSAWGFDPISLSEEGAIGDGMEHGKYSKSYEPINFAQIENIPGNLIIAWFGYIDCKYKIAQKGDAESTAYRYINSLKKDLRGAEILLVEPLPQFLDDIYLESENIPVFDYKIRRPIELEFCASLKKFASEFGITNYITQQEILNAIGLPVLRLKDTPQDRNHPVDGLLPHLNLAVYNLIIQKAMRIIS